jgi:hypothetical protein
MEISIALFLSAKFSEHLQAYDAFHSRRSNPLITRSVSMPFIMVLSLKIPSILKFNLCATAALRTFPGR